MLQSRFAKSDIGGSLRFGAAVLLPVFLLALGLTAFAIAALRNAAERADEVSAAREAQEVRLAVDGVLDELAQSQVGVAIWSPLVLELRKTHKSWTWINDNVGSWLNYVFAHDIDLIVDRNDRPIYAMTGGRQVSPSQFSQIESAALPLIDAVRGRRRESPNPHERLPLDGVGPTTTVRTSSRAIHATDLVTVRGRPAALSVMRIIPDTINVTNAAEPEPLLVSLRYLDTGFTRSLAKGQLIAGARVQTQPFVAAGERALPLQSSRMGRVGYLVWRPDRPGQAVWRSSAPHAALALMALFGALAALIFSVAALLRKDRLSLKRLAAAHLELQAKEAQAHHLAFHDTLTGLPNRAFFNAIVDQKLVESSAQSMRWAILLADLDRFKQVNDSLGHLGGDHLIQQVAATLQKLIRPDDVVARLGGDEFAILLSNRADEAEIDAIANAIVAAVRQPFVILGTNAYIGVSIGVVCAPRGGDRSELMRMADIAMYRVKAAGRDGVRFFSEEMDESVKLRRGLEQDLREAIAREEELEVFYQPQMNPSGSTIIGLEALLRWHHPTRGLLSPEMFIPIAEETGLVRALGRMVLRDACAVARAWPQLSMAVNLSAVQFRSPGLATDLMEIVHEAGAEPSQIELEVTETVLLDDDVLVQGSLSELRGAGFRIALDDFGTGYSGLSYLNKFDVDKIKIDRSFIKRLGEADDAAAIIHAVVRLGHAMGLSVAAEGVETSDQRRFLETAGCNELQEFLFSAAVPAGALPALFDRSRQAA